MEDSDSLPAMAMAMDLPVTASLGPVGPLLRQLRSSAECEIQSLTDDLDRLCISLMNHSEAEEPSYRAKSWMSEIRELLYDIKNYMDDAPFILNQDEDAQEELTPEEKREIAMLRFKALEDRVTDASKRRESYKIDQNINKAKFLPSTRRRLPVPFLELIDRARMDDLAMKLMGTAEEKHLKVVSLAGPEGVGKTTLTKRLYQMTGGQFHCRAFVRVSPNPDMRRLLSSIFTQIQLPGSSEYVSHSKPACFLDPQVLIKKIQQYLQEKRYLIIIDDLCSISVWDIIRSAFPDGGCESRIITTTQSEDVASACCSYKPQYIFKVKPLKDEQSRKLLFSMVFGSQDFAGCSEDFVRVSDEIISKSGGLPLLIVNISSLLPTPSELNYQQWKEIRDFLPSTMKTNHTSEGIKEVLNLICNNLSSELKTCLLYFAMYPEGYTVDNNDLVKQWASEGFTGEGQNKEDVAGEYFDELVSRGMIQVVDMNYPGVLSCTLHSMVHDLIVKKSMEGNFVISVDNFQSAVWLPNKVRRLSIQFGGARSARLPSGITLSDVRSLAFFGFHGCAKFIEKCKFLQVLTLHVWADQDKDAFDLTGIGQLLQLRYLKVACNIAVKLPDQIQALEYLETLEVDAILVAIPLDIGLLSKLSSLYAWTMPVQMMVFNKGTFLFLKYFKFKCSVPWLKFEAGSMPDLQNLDLCFNAHEADQLGIVPIGIEHLSGLEEINANIWGADTDVGSNFRTVVSNHPSNPRINVHLIDCIFHGEEEKKQAAGSSMSTLSWSKRTSTSLGSSEPVEGAAKKTTLKIETGSTEVKAQTFAYGAEIEVDDNKLQNIDSVEEMDIQHPMPPSPMNERTDMSRQLGWKDENEQADIRIYALPGSSRGPDSGDGKGKEEKKQDDDTRMSTLRGSPSCVPIPDLTGLTVSLDDLDCSVKEVVRLSLVVKAAADTVRHNKAACIRLTRTVDLVCAIMAPLEHMDMAANPVMRAALTSFGGVLRRGHNLVKSCQKEKTIISALFRSRNVSKQLEAVNNDIITQLMITSFAFNSYTQLTILQASRGPGVLDSSNNSGESNSIDCMGVELYNQTEEQYP